MNYKLNDELTDEIFSILWTYSYMNWWLKESLIELKLSILCSRGLLSFHGQQWILNSNVIKVGLRSDCGWRICVEIIVGHNTILRIDLANGSIQTLIQ